MRRLIYFLSLFFIWSNGLCQSKCDCFDRLYHLSNYYNTFDDSGMLAINAMKDAISFLQPEMADEYYSQLADLYKHNNQLDSATYYYSKSVQYGADKLSDIINEGPEISDKIDLAKMKSFDLKNREKIDFDLYDKFAQEFFLDQSFINNTFFPLSALSDTADAAKRVIYSQLFSMAQNHTFSFVKFILDNYNYPYAHNLGFMPKFMVLVAHMVTVDDEKATYIINKLEELNLTCNFPRRSLILFFKDRIIYTKSTKTICGLIGYDRFNNILDITKSDSVRFQYNLLRIKEDAGISIILPKQYNPLPYPKNYFCLKKYHIN